MESSSNGSRKPWGIHGEGCTCGTEHEHLEAEEQVAAPDKPGKRGPNTVFINQDENNLHEIVWSGVSDALASHLFSSFVTCGLDEEPLSDRQQIHLIAGAMRAFALAKEGAQIVESSYMRMLSSALPAITPEPDLETDKTVELKDVGELFNNRDTPGADE